MRWCPNDDCKFLKEIGHRSTFEDRVERCVDCGTSLRSGEPAPPPAEELRAVAQLVTVGDFEHSFEAESARTALEEQGVPVWLDAVGHTAGTDGKRPFLVRVREDDAGAAREILGEIGQHDVEVAEDFDPEAHAETLPPVCPKCGGSDIDVRERPRRWGGLLGGGGLVRMCRRCEVELDD